MDQEKTKNMFAEIAHDLSKFNLRIVSSSRDDPFLNCEPLLKKVCSEFIKVQDMYNRGEPGNEIVSLLIFIQREIAKIKKWSGRK